MKIIFANRNDCLSNKGGDTVQMLLTKDYLEKKYNLNIEICLDPSELKIKEFDILHVFNIQTYSESYDFIKVARSRKIPVVLTPVYWDLNYCNAYYILTRLKLYKPYRLTPGLSNFLRVITNPFLPAGYLSGSYRRSIAEILSSIDILLPNSTEEWNIIRNHFRFELKNPPSIIPNAIELKEEINDQLPEKDQDLIIQVGRISPFKNQAATVLALKGMKNKQLLLIGRVENHDYYKYVQRLSTKHGGITFIDEINYTGLEEYYRKASVHVLPSLRESPGLTSLEAFLHGCEIVISNNLYGPVDYYQFSQIGHICNPFDLVSISDAIKNSFINMKNNPDTRMRYFQFFNYNTVADLTFKAYVSLGV